MAKDSRRPPAGRAALRTGNVQRFDRWATTYDMCTLQPLYQAAHRSLMSVATALTPSPQRILDLGCGTGLLLRSLHDTMPHATVIGVDASSPMLNVATTQGSDIGWVQASAEQLPFSDTTFDLVTASFTTRHWRDVYQAAREIARILTAGGTLAIADAFTRHRPAALIGLLHRGQLIPEPLRTALPLAGLSCSTAWTAEGYGPIPTITVMTAIRRQPVPTSLRP